jgi:hypothetical protein
MAQLSGPQVQYELFEPGERVPRGANLHAVPQTAGEVLPGEHAFNSRLVSEIHYTDPALPEKTDVQAFHSKHDVLVI